ncbi:MAG: ribosome small subunit-dependent GTPase A [Gemmatimonadota bacterium]
MMEKLSVLGWDSDWNTAFQGVDTEGAWPARVTAQHRDRWEVQSSRGHHEGRIVGGGTAGLRPVTGDWVACVEGPQESDPCSIVAVLPRRSALRRGSAGESQGQQVLAANVDRLWIVQSLETPPNLRSLERYLAVAWESGATPEIVLSKSDLCQDLEAATASAGGVAFGTPVWVVSVENEGAMNALRDSLSTGQTVALIGPSGAGKSTLINRLAESVLARTGEVRSGDRKGRHTTTGRELFPIHGGALLLDTPGMRELKVLDLDEGLGHAFPEIEELSAGCRFRDCSHSSEPGCAVLEAVEEGRLDPDRLASYRKLEAEAEYQRRKVDPQARAEYVAEWKTAMRTVKHHQKYKERD